MKKKFFTFIILISTICICLSITYAWPLTFQEVGMNIEGQSTNGYYASGKGSIEDPYIIKSPKHLYNLAWLQNLGFYDDKKYYFEIDNDIDMSGIAIPPIGINGNGNGRKSHPFISSFDGKGFTISNLIIDTRGFYYYPEIISSLSAFDFGNYIGMFGYIGKVNIDSNIVYGDVKNFYLDGIKVNSINDISLVGLVGGYISGSLSSIGVLFSQIALPTGATKLTVNSNISNYGIVGDYDSDTVTWQDKAGAEGIGYGGSFDVQRMAQRLSLIYENKQSATPSSYLPDVDSQTLLKKGEVAPLTVTNDMTSSFYYGSNAKETVSLENVGYFCGNQNKFYKSTFKFCNYSSQTDSAKTTYSWENKKVPRTFFKRTGDNATTTSENIVAMSENEINVLPDGIKEILNYELNTEISFNTIRLQQKFEGTEGNDGGKQSAKPSISYYNEIYQNVFLPNNGIWFRPKIVGKFRFVVYTGSNGSDFTLYKLKRSNSNSIFNSGSITSTNALTDLHSYSLPFYILAYFEYEVTEEEIEQGYEFLLANDRGGNGAYFLYLDIGINGSSQPKTSEIGRVGFVYSYTLGNEKEYSEIDSSVLFSINGEATSLAIIQFIKNQTNGVVYYFSDSSGIDVKKIGQGLSQKSDDKIQ